MKEERRRWYSLLSSCIFLTLQLYNDKVALWCRRGSFHFLLTSNSRYLILTGNAKLWGCYPNCSSEFSASGEPRKYEKQSGRNYLLLVVLGSALVFSKVCSWGFSSPLSVNVTQTTAAVWGECVMRRTLSLYCDEGGVQSGKSINILHGLARPSHTVILPSIHTQPSACATKCQLMHINKACQPTKQQNSKEKKSFSFLFFHQCALPRKSRHEAFTQQQQPYLLLNNTIFSLCDWAVLHTLWALRRLYSLSVTVTAQIIPAQWGMFQGPSTECHSNHFKLQDFLQPIKKRVHNS